MNYLDNQRVLELNDELERLAIRKKDIKRYHDYPRHLTMEQALQEVEEEEECIRMKLEEFKIIHSDYFDDEF